MSEKKENEKDPMELIIDGLSDKQKDDLREILSKTSPDGKIVMEVKTETNRVERKLPDVTPTVKDNSVTETVNINKESSYEEEKYEFEQVGTMGDQGADTTIVQPLVPDAPRSESNVIPNKVIKNPLTEDRGGYQSEGDILNQNIQVAHKFFNPDQRASAEGKYRKEGGRVKHAAFNDVVTAAGNQEGGQIAKGFDVNAGINSKNNPFKYLMTGFTVRVDKSSIAVNQGFDKLDQAKSSIDENIFMLNYSGKLRISKVIDGTPVIKDRSGKDLYVYNDNRWVDNK